MGFGAIARGFRTGLVAVAILFVCIPGFSQVSSQPADTLTSAEPTGNPSLKDLEEIQSSYCKLRYKNLLNLLFLLPGMIFFFYAVLTRGSRKMWFFFTLVLLLGAGGPDRFAPLRQAEELFAARRYAEAIDIYTQAEQDFPCNSAILYNIGILHHYLGQQGYAVHYLRRSLRLAPGDRQARAALQYLQQSYGLVGQVSPPFPVHPDIAFQLLLVFVNAAFITGAFVVRTKKVHFLIALVLIAIAVLGCAVFFVGRLLAESRSVGVVSEQSSELYRVPEQDSKSWFELPMGTSLWIRGRSGQYYLVETPSQIDGWVRSDTLLID
jgi:hypothetical protein